MTMITFLAAECRRSRSSGHMPGDKPAAWAAAVVVIYGIMAIAAPAARAGGTASQAQAGSQSQAPEKGWIGLSRGELFKKLGRPSRIVEFPDTGGQMIIYARPGEPHYVFEIGPTGKVDKAAQVK